MDLAGAHERPTDLAGVAAAAVRDGCIGETVASLVAAEQLACCEDGAVRAVLSAIAEDEARHAELAWRFVRWAVETGDARVREAVAAAFAEGARASFAPVAGAASSADLTSAGRLPAGEIACVGARAMADVVLPCARSLLGDPGVERNTTPAPLHPPV
jgi:hypothetical protein